MMTGLQVTENIHAYYPRRHVTQAPPGMVEPRVKNQRHAGKPGPHIVKS